GHARERIMSAWRWLFRRRAEAELRKEIAAHMAERIDGLIDEGLSETDARRQARLEFGNPVSAVEQSREQWIAPWLSSLRQDLRYALRAFARQPGFSFSAIGILALGIAPVTMLFTILNATLFK